MPNWCLNTIFIAGEPSDLDAIQKNMERTGSFLSGNVPIGEWNYDKAMEWWGTKWEDQDGTWSCIDTLACVRFDTAWAPPLTALEWLTAERPVRIVVVYSEPGNDSYGWVGFNDGRSVSEASVDPEYPPYPEREDEQEDWYQEVSDIGMATHEQLIGDSVSWILGLTEDPK